jgi:hypothetical protein
MNYWGPKHRTTTLATSSLKFKPRMDGGGVGDVSDVVQPHKYIKYKSKQIKPKSRLMRAALSAS